jgi:hypothetical protein
LIFDLSPKGSAGKSRTKNDDDDGRLMKAKAPPLCDFAIFAAFCAISSSALRAAITGATTEREYLLGTDQMFARFDRKRRTIEWRAGFGRLEP